MSKQVQTIWTDLLGSEVRYRGSKFKTRTIEAGTGEPLLLMHGIGGHAEAFSRNIKRLSKQFRVFAMDFIWHGFSSKPPVPKALHPVYIAQVLDLIDDIGCDRVHIEGESLGGWIALELALNHPDRVNKLILNTAYGVNLQSEEEITEDKVEGLIKLRDRSVAAVLNPTRDVVRKRLEWLVASPDRITDEIIDIRLAIYSDLETRDALKSVFSTAFDPDRVDQLIEKEQLSAINAPSLVLWSSHNPGLGPEAGKRIAELLPNAEFYCVDDAGHWPQWEHPEEHDRVVLEFLKR